MKKQSKKALAFILATGICIGSLALFPISANAMTSPASDPGTYLGSAIPKNPDLPLIMTEENLTYDIQTLPEKYFDDREKSHDLSGYSDSLTAEYVIHNPTSTSISATYTLPIGIIPKYLPDDKSIADIAKGTGAIDLHVSGNKPYYEYRFTYSPSNEPNLSEEVSKIYDDYLPLGDILPDSKVTKVTYRIEYDLENAQLIFVYRDNYDHAFGRSEDFYSVGDLSKGVYKEIYYLGDAPKIYDQWQIHDYDNQTIIKLGTDEVSVVSTQEVTFRELVLTERPQSSAISELDWYNAAISRLSQNGNNGLTKQNHLYMFDMYYRNLLCWVVYDIEVPAMGDVSCTVKLPLFPSAETHRYPSIYVYDYLFSAKEGDNSRKVTVKINTPYYLIDHTFPSHKTDSGYEITVEDGAYGVLSFDICKSKSPASYPPALLVVSIFFTSVLLVFLLVILGFTVFCILNVFGSLFTEAFALTLMTALLILCIILTVREARKGRKNKLK